MINPLSLFEQTQLAEAAYASFSDENGILFKKYLLIFRIIFKAIGSHQLIEGFAKLSGFSLGVFN